MNAVQDGRSTINLAKHIIDSMPDGVRPARATVALIVAAAMSYVVHMDDDTGPERPWEMTDAAVEAMHAALRKDRLG